MLLCKHMRISHICQIQRDQTPMLNGYRVINSHRANSVHTAESPDPVIQIKSICIHYEYKFLEWLLLDFQLISW